MKVKKGTKKLVAFLLAFALVFASAAAFMGSPLSAMAAGEGDDREIISEGSGFVFSTPIDAEHFPDENFRSFLRSQSYGSDGILTETEIASITSMNCYYKGIADFTGIEHFTALTTLNCSANQITSLDLSNNTALTELNCTASHLTSLDLSHNRALTTLSCGGNQLTSLDLSHNTALTSLYCSNNPFASLIVPFDRGVITATVSNGGHGAFNPSSISFSDKTLTIADPVSADPTYAFVEWQITGTGTTQRTMADGTRFTIGSEDATIIAVWNHIPETYTLTINEIYLYADGTTEKTETSTSTHEDGEEVTITKTAPAGYTLYGEASQTFTMDEDKTIVFTYVKVPET